MQRSFYTLTLFSLLFAVGCGGNVVIRGTATMADGTAIESGIVTFHGDTGQYTADIHNGSFSPGITRCGEGIPPGFYRITVGGVFREVITPGADPERGEYPEHVPLIHSRYANPDTSGFSIDTSTERTIDLVLDPAEEGVRALR